MIFRDKHSGDGRRQWLRYAQIIPYLWVVLFFAAPFFIILKISFADPIVAQPPFTSLFDWAKTGFEQIHVTFDNYLFLIQDSFYSIIYLSSLKMAAISTVLCLLLGYPIAYYIARQPDRRRNILLLGIILPFWTSFLLRIYAWLGLLGTNGVFNNFLMWLGVIDAPIPMLYNDFAVYVGIVYSYLPFMILPLYANLAKMNLDLHDAAADLGAKPWHVFKDVILPQSRPGIIGGCMLVFIPASGEFVIPALLGGADTLMIGSILWDEFFKNRDWPVASAVSVILLLMLVPPMMWFQKSQAQQEAE